MESPSVPLLARINNRPATDPETWSTDQVQDFFKYAENGNLSQFASQFSLVDGPMLCSLTKQNLTEILPGAQGMVVFQQLRNLRRQHQRRRLSSTGNGSGMDEDIEMNEDGSFVPFFIVPSFAAIIVGITFITLSILLATSLQDVASKMVDCTPQTLFAGTKRSKIMASSFISTTSSISTSSISSSTPSTTPTPPPPPPHSSSSCRNVIIEYASIPIISVLFTYFHIWLALWLTFFPIRYVGCCQLPHDDKTWLARTFGNMGLGWQGIIPFKAAGMARKSVKLMTEKLLDVKEVFSRIDPLRVTEEIEPALHNLLGPIVDAVGRERAPVAWEIMPFSVKQEIIARAEKDTPSVITGMMRELTDNIENVFDLEEMVVATFIKDKMLLVEMFIKCGRSELAVIRDFGGWMGFVFGVIQMVVYHFMPKSPWMLPIFGGIVGAATNWVALLMIFKPTWPIRCCCGLCTIQGLFLKRQREVAAAYARMTTRDVLSTKSMMKELLRGKSSDRLLEIVHRHVMESIDNQAGQAKPFAQLILGSVEYEKIKTAVSDRTVDAMGDMLGHAEEYFEEALDLERTLHVKMSALTPDAFESLLRPVFSEDEWKLIALGGILGVCIGCVQMQILGQ